MVRCRSGLASLRRSRWRCRSGSMERVKGTSWRKLSRFLGGILNGDVCQAFHGRRGLKHTHFSPIIELHLPVVANSHISSQWLWTFASPSSTVSSQPHSPECVKSVESGKCTTVHRSVTTRYGSCLKVAIWIVPFSGRNIRSPCRNRDEKRHSL
jgi:hypothetical protein